MSIRDSMEALWVRIQGQITRKQKLIRRPVMMRMLELIVDGGR